MVHVFSPITFCFFEKSTPTGTVRDHTCTKHTTTNNSESSTQMFLPQFILLILAFLHFLFQNAAETSTDFLPPQ